MTSTKSVEDVPVEQFPPTVVEPTRLADTTRREPSPPNREPRWRGLQVGLKVGLALSIAALVLPLVGSQWAASEARRTVQDEVLDGQTAAVSALLGRLAVAYDTSVRGATSAAERPELTAAVATGDSGGAAVVLRNVAELGFYQRLAVYDEAGALLASAPSGAAAKIPNPVPAAPLVTKPTAGSDGVVVTVRAALRNDGVPVGQLVAEVVFSGLVGGEDGLSLPGGVDVALVDRNAIILASSLGRASEGKKILAPEALAIIRDGKNTVATFFAPRLGYDVISTYVIPEDRPWRALATSKRDAVLAASDRLDRRLLTGGLLFALLSLGTGGLVAGYVAVSERGLRRARAEVAAHNDELADTVDQLDGRSAPDAK